MERSSVINDGNLCPGFRFAKLRGGTTAAAWPAVRRDNRCGSRAHALRPESCRLARLATLGGAAAREPRRIRQSVMRSDRRRHRGPNQDAGASTPNGRGADRAFMPTCYKACPLPF